MKFLQKLAEGYSRNKAYVLFLLIMWVVVVVLQNTSLAIPLAYVLGPLLKNNILISVLFIPAILFVLPFVLFLELFSFLGSATLPLVLMAAYPFLWIFLLSTFFPPNTPASVRWKAIAISAIVSTLLLGTTSGLMQTSRPDAQDSIALAFMHGLAAILAVAIMSGFIVWSKRFKV
jgi:hypothetical protein